MRKEVNVINYFVLCNKLKNVIRTGWLDWKIKSERVESVAEHVYGVQMLAVAMYSEYEYDIDLYKVMMMLAVHELEEILIGDIAMMDPLHANKKEMGHKAVEQILAPLLKGNEVRDLIFEFDERKTKEAQFAYHCDKLECDLQAKLYDEAGYIDLLVQDGNKEFEEVSEKIKAEGGKVTFSQIWMHTDERLFSDENFKEVFYYARDNNIAN